jgi:hypothetical protein
MVDNSDGSYLLSLTHETCTIEEHVEVLRAQEANITNLSLYPNHFNFVDQTFITEFIAKSTSLENVRIESRSEWGGGAPIHSELIRKCVMAAKSNPNVIGMQWQVDIDNHVVRSVTETMMIGGPKFTELCFSQTGEIDPDERELLNVTVASLQNVNELKFLALRDDVLSDLMLRLAARESPSLTNLIFFFCNGRATDLPGIDTFLNSTGSSSLQNIWVAFDNINRLAMERLAIGLSQNTSIEKFTLLARSVSQEAADHLANYIRQARPSLKELDLDNSDDDSTYFQKKILHALSTNTTLRKLCLNDGFYNPTCMETVSSLLIQNSYLKELDLVSEEERIDGTCIRNMASGLSGNSTLQSLSISNYSDSIDARPLFDALVSNPHGSLQNLSLYGFALAEGVVRHLVATMRNPAFQLKDLNLCVGMDDQEIIHLFRGAQSSSSLRALHLTRHGQLDRGTWSAIASIIPKLALTELFIEINDRDEEGSVTASIQEELLSGVDANYSLERVGIYFGQRDTDSFSSSLQGYCTRNLVVKASNALLGDFSVSKLPLASVPVVVDALYRRCNSFGQYKALSGTILFSVLRSRCYPSEPWGGIASHFEALESEVDLLMDETEDY